MANKPKFHEKRSHTAGNQRVDTGIKRGSVVMRLHPRSDRPFTLTLDEAEDLADALDAALAAQEDDPLT